MLHTVTKDEPTSAHTSLSVKFALNGGQAAEGVVITDESRLFASHMRTAQCDNMSCLNYLTLLLYAFFCPTR